MRWTTRTALLTLALAVASGCQCGSPPASCAAGTGGCTCRVDGSCDAGLTCGAGNACAACAPGLAGCACLANGSCDAGLACRGSTCATCVAGAESCACTSTSTCDAALSCRNGVCVADACPDGTLACACRADGSCDASLTCASGTCRTCTADVAGCPCDNGLCQGLVCEGTTGACRAAKGCDACALYQQCTPGTVIADATCLPSCDVGFVWNSVAARCDPDPNATCAASEPGSILGACVGAYRACVEDGTSAHCGGCLEGYLEESRTCRPVKTCDSAGCTANHLSCTPPGPHADAVCGGCAPGYAQSGAACVALTCAEIQAGCDAKNEVCDEPPGGGAVCGACKAGLVRDVTTGACRPPYSCATLPPCPADQTCTPGTATSDAYCRDAICPTCQGPGEDGVSPTPTTDGRCICKTLPGWFYAVGGIAGALPCDADQDGWVRAEARYYLESNDPALKDNARCDLRRIDRFWLQDDRGSPPKLITLTSAIPLYESTRNDDPARLEQVSGTAEVPIYGAGGRALRAAELNGFTKACVGEKADHNDNKLNDVSEWGRPPYDQAPVAASSDLPSELVAVYTRFSYFIELHRGWYEAGAVGGPGSYHIAEKRRGVGGGFPLRYGLEASGVRTSDFWQDCPRSRDAWFSPTAPAIGMDFASVSAPNRTWKGMTHHSQFKCVQVVDDTTYATKAAALNRHLQTVETLGAPGTAHAPSEYLRATVNECELTADPSVPIASGPNPRDPVMTCKPVLPSPEHVGKVVWAAVQLAESSQYFRGCIVQCNGFPYLCPGSDPLNPSAQGCYHVCGDLAASEAKDLVDGAGAYRLRGEVPVIPVTDTPLADSASGYRLVPR
ncbi:variable surface family protein [Anaeromyxobacter terrae]|uniref:hypothetical protein n=1 Tax=Anaeromyxobacter terrae TaxID=2925406 RepID=UPI001F5A6111|nr:hypothetical protein [Anaeromyxobacter sp. SG22]